MARLYVSATLDRIVADKREHIASRRAAAPLRPRIDAPRGFEAALRRARVEGRTGFIAEIKRASPSRGLIRADFDPATLARAYAEAGATCLSVLTDTPHFQGADAHLAEARSAVALPILRKDFIVDPWQVEEAFAIGSDAILVILAAVDDALAAELLDGARALGLDVLVEIHNAAERDRALALGATLLGINNRNLNTMHVDLRTSIELARDLPANVHTVAESGISMPEEVRRLAAIGVSSILVGEALMRHPDIGAATRALLADG